VLEQDPIFGKIPPLEAADQEEKPEEDWHFTLLVSTGYVASALREAVSSLEPEALRQVEMTGLPALLPAFCRCNFLAFLLA
jgi:hypothetical protein